MRPYWANRLESIPLRLTTSEASALTGWVVELDADIEDAVALTLAAPAGIQPHAQVLHRLSPHVARAPVAYARFVGHLLSGTTQPFWDCHQLGPMVLKLRRGGAEEDDINRIREQSVRLGCTGAANW